MNLNQITVPSLNVGKSVSFYKKLSLKLIVEALPKYARFECPDGDSSFSIHLVDKLPSGNGVYVYFECDNLEDQVKSLQQKNIKFEEMPSQKIWLWKEARLKDPDGNQIILYHAGQNRLYPPWRLKDNT